MADAMDDLIEHLLDKVTLSRSKGFTAVDFEEAVHSFYERKNDEIENEDDRTIVDEQLIGSAFDRLSKHEDVDIQDDESASAVQLESQPTVLRSKLAGKRIFTSEERLWQTVAGHESDLNRVPGMELELLVVIAQHGPEGCLQSKATHITGQDKHSVPARTDKLAKKGYITKASVTAKHIRTSLLRLAKWASKEPAPLIESGILSYDALFDTTIALLKENGNMISIDDLYKGLDSKGKMNRKILLRCCQRLSKVGCTRLLRCRVQDEDGNPIMLAHGKGEKMVNAMQLMRDPTVNDRSTWVNFRGRLMVDRPKKSRRKKARKPDEQIVDDDESEEEEADSAEDDEGDTEDAEGETDDEAMDDQSRRDSSSEIPPQNSTSAPTPSRKSNRARRKSSLAQGADYARMFDDGESNSDQDAEFEITESASPETMRRPATNATTATSTPKKKAQPRKPSNKDASVNRPRSPPQIAVDGHGGGTGPLPMAASTDFNGTNSNGEMPASSKRQRKKSTKALEADALRAAGEPLLTEPVDRYDFDDDSDARSIVSVRDGPANIDSDAMQDGELDRSQTTQTPVTTGKPRRARGPYKRAEDGASTGKKREPVVKKREIPPEDYEEYEKYAQATAERKVRLEMKAGGKRTASMAQLDDPSEGSNKAPRAEEGVATEDQAETDEPTTAEAIAEKAELSVGDPPADRVAEVKASILAREKPGLYINPPGARNIKLENYIQRGRPRNAIIAVVKTDRLKDLSWFKDETGPRFAPKATRRRTARIGEGLAKFGEDKSLFFVEGSGSEGEERGGKRRKLGEGQSKFRFEKRGNMPTPQAGTHGTFGVLGLGLDSAVDEDEGQIQYESEAQMESPAESGSLRRTGRVSRRPSMGFNLAPLGSERSTSPDAVRGAERGGNEERAEEDPIAAAKLEMAALQRKRGRPRKDDAIRIRVLQRQIELDAAARQREAEYAVNAVASAQGSSRTTTDARKEPEPVIANDAVSAEDEPQGSTAQEKVSPLEESFASEQPAPATKDSADGEAVAQLETAADQVAVVESMPASIDATQVPAAESAPISIEATQTPTVKSTDSVQPAPTPTEKTSAPASIAGPSQEPKSAIGAAQTELDGLITIKPKKRGPENLQRIEELRVQIDDAYINGPGTADELITWLNKLGKKSALAVKRIAVLKQRFPGVGKVTPKSRVSQNVSTEDVENVDHAIAQPSGSAAVGQSTTTPITKDDPTAISRARAIGAVPPEDAPEAGAALDVRERQIAEPVIDAPQDEPVAGQANAAPAKVPEGLLSIRPSVLPSTEIGNLQTPEHTMMLSVKASQIPVTGLDVSTTDTPPVQTTRTEKPMDVPVATAQPSSSTFNPVNITNLTPIPPRISPALPQPQPSNIVLGPPGTRLEDMSNKRVSAPELFTKQYTKDHPKDKFHYVGGGKYARGERFNRAYVDKHPEEKFYRVHGEGNVVRFARVADVGQSAASGSAAVAGPSAGPSTVAAKPAIDPRLLQSDSTSQGATAGAVRRPSQIERQSGLPKSRHQDPVGKDQSISTPVPTLPSRSTATTLALAEQAQPSDQPSTSPTAADQQRTASPAQQRVPAVPDIASSATPQGGLVHSDSVRPASQTRERSATPAAVSTPRNDKWREKRAADTEERFTKAYVEAHADEHFYHRGKGLFSRGQAVNKEYVDAHPEETFKTVARRYIRLPGAEPTPRQAPPRPASARLNTPLNKELQPAASFNGVYETYSREFVDNHPEETFHHRGGGKWHPGLPPPGSTQRTGVRGPGAELWRAQAAKLANDALVAKVTARTATPEVSAAASPGTQPTATPAEQPQPTPATQATAVPAFSAAAHPVSSLLTIYKPYSPQTLQKVAGPPNASTSAPTSDGPSQRIPENEPAADVGEHAEMNGSAVGQEDEQREPTPEDDANNDEDVIMEDEYDEVDQYEPPMKEDDIDDDQYNPMDNDMEEPDNEAFENNRTSGGQENNELEKNALGWRIFFPTDPNAAVVARRTPKQQRQLENPRPTRKRARLQTVSKPSDDDLVDLTGETDAVQSAPKPATPKRKSVKGPRAPARGSKISRDLKLKALRVWPYGISPISAIPAPAMALLMHPAQTYHSATGTFGTFSAIIETEAAPEEHDDRRSLRPRTSLAKLPQALEDDFIETPGLVVKLKIKNLASVLPPDTAFESGLFETSAATDAVPMSKITGKPIRPYVKRSKRVTFQIDDSDGDEFRDDGAVEDEDMDEDSDEPDASEEEETAVARPERRKRSTGVNGELRIRDMASGPAFRDADRLVVAFALVAAVCGGLRVEGINWTLIAHALAFRYDGSFLRRRWDHFKRTRKDDVDKLREAIHEPFLAAYEDDDFPRVDFQNLNNTDWPALFDWVQTVVVPNVRLQPEAEGPQVPDLLSSREETEEQFQIKEPAALYETRLDDFFVNITEQSRRSLITRYTYGSALPGELRPKDQTSQNMTLLRSWVRAVAVTKQYNYRFEAAAKKFHKFSPELLLQVNAEMVDSKIFSQERKSRMLPGRNYHISNECLQSFRRWPARPDESRFLRFVAQAWKNINTHFQNNDQLSLVPSASDPEYLVLTNMCAQGMIHMSTIYPEIKEDFDAPFPKLSPWGYCGAGYETRRTDMSRLKFPIVYYKTAAYKDDHALLNHVPIPLHPPQIEGEVGVRIPFWVDIHGNLIDDVWDMVLRSILHLLVFRSGTTANMIEQAHGRKLWAWEIELALEWMREVGIAERVGAGNVREDGVWRGGWTTGEWWYCAFAPEVARWKAPAVVE